jgi:cell fate (sporulation/competence/biofilm development) regulator YmcA (YheA/YmcA/DUF963 family)
VDYLHPEKPVAVSPEAFGRNYFTRASAEPQDDEEVAAERTLVLEEMSALKKLSVDYLHPEKPVSVDAEVFGRNYFSRVSAEPQDEDSFDAERDLVLQDMEQLKNVASDHLHPEKPVAVAGEVFGRNYFSRASAALEETDEAERSSIMKELAALKKLAVEFQHPEKPVTVDPTVFGRNYFSRGSAEQEMGGEFEAERMRIMEDMTALKKSAVDYLHPEKSVAVDAEVFARNYFNRPSAGVEIDNELALERALVLAEAKALKDSAMGYRHPELPVQTTDFSACGRNYFDRPTAPGHFYHIHTWPEDSYEDSSLGEHLDHFHFDDDMHYEMEMDDGEDDIRAKVFAAVGDKVNTSSDKDGEGGNLSRSPSSVMLFTEDAIYE